MWFDADRNKSISDVDIALQKYHKVPRSTLKGPELPQTTLKHLKIPTSKYLKNT